MGRQRPARQDPADHADPRPRPAPPPTRNIAGAAVAAASNEPVPVRFWIKALNDGIVKAAPLPPDMWGNWNGAMPARSWIEYRWPAPVTLDGSRIWFFADQPAGSGVGVAPPKSWHIEYWNGAAKRWQPVDRPSGYGTEPGRYQDTRFTPVTTRCLRAVFDASQANGTNAAVAVQEWEALAPTVGGRAANGPVGDVAPCR